MFDKIGWEILRELQQNARISISELSRRVCLSAPAVQERIQKFEEAGVILGYRAVLDLERIGLTLRVIVTIRVHTGKTKALINHLRTMPSVYECCKVTGPDCMVIKLALAKVSYLDEVVTELSEYGEPSTSIVLSSPIEGKVWRQA
jgi:Lrp/AsnC family leucine-responsive transcriptional regulator